MCKTYRRIVDFRTARPLGLIALQKEICAVDYIERNVRQMGLPIHGSVVDCIYFSAHADEGRMVEQFLAKPNTLGARFALKEDCVVPNCEQGPNPPPPPSPSTPPPA